MTKGRRINKYYLYRQKIDLEYLRIECLLYQFYSLFKKKIMSSCIINSIKKMIDRKKEETKKRMRERKMNKKREEKKKKLLTKTEKDIKHF